MIRDPEKLWEFEKRLVASTPVDVRANFRIADEMYRYARKLGMFPGPDLLEGVDVNIRLAKVLRSVRRAP